MMRIVILLSCTCFVGMVLLVSPVISFAPKIGVSGVRVQAATKMETMMSAENAVEDTSSLSEEVTEAMINNVAPDATIAEALAKTGIVGTAAIVAPLQGGGMKKSKGSAKAVDESVTLSQVTATMTNNALPDATLVAAPASSGIGGAEALVASLHGGAKGTGTGFVNATLPVTLSSLLDEPVAKITDSLEESDLDSTLSFSSAASKTTWVTRLEAVTSLASSSGEEVTAAMGNNVAPDETMAVALASTGIAGAAAVVSSLQGGMKKSKGSARAFDDAVPLSQEVAAAMINNALPDAAMAVALASAGIAGAAAVVSYLQGGNGIGALDIAPPLTFASELDEPVGKTTASSTWSDLSPLSFVAVETTVATGLKPVTSLSSSGPGKPAAAAPVSGGSYLDTLSGAAKPAAVVHMTGESYLNTLSEATKPAMATAPVSGGSYLNATSGATKPTAAVPEWSSSSVRSPPSVASIGSTMSRPSEIVDSPIDTVSAAAEGALAPRAGGERDKQEVIKRLKSELDLAREFFSQNKIKPAPRPMPPGRAVVVSKDAALEAASVDTMSDAIKGSVTASSRPVGYEPAAAAVDAASASLVEADRAPPREVIDRLKTELELAREFLSLNTIKPAPRPLLQGSVSSAVVSKVAGQEATSVDAMPDSVQDSVIADASPVAYETGEAAVHASNASLVEAARVPLREVLDRLKTELELAREFFSHNKIKFAPRQIPLDSVFSDVVSKDAALEAPSVETLSDAVQGFLIADSSPVAYEPAVAAVDESSASFVESARFSQREVIDRLKTELQLAREFFSQKKIKSAPRPIPPGSVSGVFIAKDAALEATSVDTWSDAAQGFLIEDSSSVAYEPATAAIDASSATLVEAGRFSPREVLDRLKTELELAREFFSHNKIKSAPRPIPPGSVSSVVISKDAALEAAFVETLSEAVQGSSIADSRSAAYEPSAAAVDASSSSQVEAARFPQREVIDRLKAELELAREFFSLNTIKPAPRPIPPGSVSSAVVSKDAGQDATIVDVDAMTDSVQDSVITDSSPVAYEPSVAAVGASNASLVEAARVPLREVLNRLKTELELAREFFSHNKIKSAPRQIQLDSVSSDVVSKDAALEAPSVETLTDAVQGFLIADSSPVAYEPAVVAVDESSASFVESARFSPREVIDRLKTELQLAREFFSQKKIKSAPRPIPPGSVSGVVMSKDAALEATSVDTWSDAAQGFLIADSSSVAYEPAAAEVDASSATLVEAGRFSPREVLDRLKTELELAREFFSHNKIKSAPRPIPPGSVSSVVISKDAALEAAFVETLSEAVQGSSIADSRSAAYEPSAAAVDASSASLLEEARVPPREVIDRLKTELELAREFFSHNKIKSAPRLVPPDSISSVVVSKVAALEPASVDTLSDAVQGSLIADSSSVAYEPAAAAVDASSASQVEAARFSQREVIDRLKTELELSREFFSLNTIIAAPCPIQLGTVSRGAGLDDSSLAKPVLAFDPRDKDNSSPESPSVDTIAVGSTTIDADPAATIDESSGSRVEASRVEVIERLKHELDLARDFIAQNEIKRAPPPIQPGSISSAFVSKDVGLDKKRSATPASAFVPHDEIISSLENASVDTMLVGSTTPDATSPTTTINELSASQVKASRFEVMERLKRELDLARDFISQNEIKCAPPPIMPDSVSSAFVSKDVGLDETSSEEPASAFDPHYENFFSPGSSSVDTISVGSTTADAGPATTIDESRASQVKASRVEVMERLKRELDLARDFFSLSTIKAAPRSIPPGSFSSAVVSKGAGLDGLPLTKRVLAFDPRDVDISSSESSSLDNVGRLDDCRCWSCYNDDESSVSRVKVSHFEVIERLKHELDVARDFISQNEIKRAPPPIPSGPASSTFVSKDVGLEENPSAKPALAFGPHNENISSPVRSSVDTVSVGLTTTNASPTATIDELKTSQRQASRVPSNEVMERLKHELDLALEFFAYNTTKPAPRPVPPGSLSNTVVSNGSDSSAFALRDLDLDATPLVKPAPAFHLNHVNSPAPGGSHEGTMSDVTRGSTIVVALADSLSVSHSHVKASRAPPSEALKRLQHELDLAIEFFSRNVIKPAPRPIPPDSISNNVVSNGSDSSASISKDVELGATLPVKAAPAFFRNDASSTVPASSSGASSSSQVKAARILPREVIERLMQELELAREFFSHNRIKPAPRPVPRQ